MADVAAETEQTAAAGDTSFGQETEDLAFAEFVLAMFKERLHRLGLAGRRYDHKSETAEQAAEWQTFEDFFAHHKAERTAACRLKQQQVKKRNMV